MTQHDRFNLLDTFDNANEFANKIGFWHSESESAARSAVRARRLEALAAAARAGHSSSLLAAAAARAQQWAG